MHNYAPTCSKHSLTQGPGWHMVRPATLKNHTSLFPPHIKCPRITIADEQYIEIHLFLKVFYVKL